MWKWRNQTKPNQMKTFLWLFNTSFSHWGRFLAYNFNVVQIHSFCLLPSLPPENQPNTQRFIRQTLVRTKALKSNIRTSAAKNIQDGSIQTAAECDMPDNKPPAIVLPVRHKVVCTILSDSAARLFFASIQTNTPKYQIHQYQIGPRMYHLPF